MDARRPPDPPRAAGATRRSLPRRLARSFVAFLAWGAAGLAALGLYAWLVEPSRIVVEQATLERAARTDAGKEGRYRIAFMSDFDMTGSPGRFERRVRRAVNRLEPDLVAIGGDFYGGDRWEPTDEQLGDLRAWLAGFRARDGVVVVWGEQELRFAHRIRAVLPDGVRELHGTSELHEAGEATVRVAGPEGLHAPLWVEPRGGGRLRAGRGRTLTLARSLRPGADGSGGIEVTARLTTGRAGDGPGLAVLEDGAREGYRFRVSPETLEWSLLHERGARRYGPSRAARPLVAAGRPYLVRVRVEPREASTLVRSRIWPAETPEPRRWTIDLVDTGADRPRRGAVAVLAGGVWSDSGRSSWDWIEARDLAGALLMRDDFDDAGAFERDWHNPGHAPDEFDATVVVGHEARPFLQIPEGGRSDIDLLLAGHTHGGQVRLPVFGPLHLDEGLPRGWSMGFVPLPSRDGWLYTTRGLGVSKIPLRFLCPPEVTRMDVILRHRPPLP